MSLPRVVAVAPGSPAQRAGLEPGDEVVTLNGHQPRDVIQWQLLTDDADLDVEIRRGGLDLDLSIPKDAGEPLGPRGTQRWLTRGARGTNHSGSCSINNRRP